MSTVLASEVSVTGYQGTSRYDASQLSKAVYGTGMDANGEESAWTNQDGSKQTEQQILRQLNKNTESNYIKVDDITGMDSYKNFSSSSGFDASVYKDTLNPGNITMAIRGTEPKQTQDIINDLIIASGNVPKQYTDAMNAYTMIKNAYPDANISITGHSLGGGLATLLGAATGCPTTAFNAPGMREILSSLGLNPGQKYNNIKNYSNINDPISKFGNPIGENYTTGWSDWPFPGGHLDLDNAGSATPVPNKMPNFPLPGNLLPFPANLLLNAFPKLFSQAEGATVPRDPLILDLNGDGIQTTSLEDGIHFDANANGFAEKMAWISDEDGALCVDLNNNGQIDDGKEIFGDHYVLEDGQLADSGFQALSEYDSNLDGTIDVNDENFADLRIAKAGELLTLDQAGVKSIDLACTSTNSIDQNGNTILGTGSFTRTDDSTSQIAEYNFQADTTDSIAIEWLDVPEDVQGLPDLKGIGNVYSLHQTIVRDTSGDLKALIESFIAENDQNARSQLVDQILIKWASCENINPNDLTRGYNAQKLAILEKFIGHYFKNDANSIPNVAAAPFLDSSYAQLKEFVTTSLLSQAQYKYLFDAITINYDTDTNTLYGDVSGLITIIQDELNVDPVKAKEELSSFAYIAKKTGIADNLNYDQFYNTFSALGDEFKVLLDIADKAPLTGTTGPDLLEGTPSDEIAFGNAGNDTIYTRQGNDIVYGGDGDDYIDSCEDNDIVYGEAGNDTIRAGSDNDTLIGGTGNDSLEGGAGNDTYIFVQGDGQDTINEGYDNTNSDSVVLQGRNSSVARFGAVSYGNDTNFYISFTDSDDVITLKSQHDSNYRVENYVFDDIALNYEDVISQLETHGTEGDDTILASCYAEIIRGFAGNDYIYSGNGDDTVYGGAGNDIIDSENGDNTVYAGTGNDYIYSGNGNDTVYGEEGNDTIYSEYGDDTVYGGKGNDIIYSGNGNNTVYGGEGNDSLQGGAGSDTYIFAQGDGQDTINEGYDNTNSDSIVLQGRNSSVARFRAVSYGNETSFYISFTDSNDVITLKNQHDPNYRIENYVFDDITLTYEDVSSQLETHGTEGDDTILASCYAEIIRGFAGNDYIYSGNGDDTIYGGEGNDIIYSENGDDIVYAGTGNDEVYGGTGSDTLSGGIGNDTLSGGAGNDTYIVDNTGDIITENANEGIDSVQSSITYTLGANVENLTLTGISDINANGNELDNTIIGNDGINKINGGLGADTMIGGKGIDIYTVDNIGDTIIEYSDGNWDVVLSYLQDYTLDYQLEQLNLNGNLNSTGTGNSRSNKFFGNSGINTFYGLGGDDTYVIEDDRDIIVENANEGIDLVQSSITYTLGANIENLTLTGLSNINATGNELNNYINGTSYNNYIQGLDGNDTIKAWGGIDTIDGGTGADLMFGGFGNDTYIVDNTGDTVIENAGEGIDLVNSSVSFTLGANVENLTLTGISDINANGNELDNTIIGNDGINKINGGLGADTMIGGKGIDIYTVDNIGDTIIEYSDGNWDVVLSYLQDYTLDYQLEQLNLNGFLNSSGTGNSRANKFMGNSGINTFYGLGGDDTYVIEDDRDIIVENANEGRDLVQASVTYSLSANIENLTLTGTSDINGYGNGLNNSITGNSANNTLTGNTGNDILNAGDGDDSYIFNSGDNLDTITDSSGNDLVSLGSSVNKSNIAIYEDASHNLLIDYGSTANADKITITGWNNTSNQIEKVQLSDGTYLSNVDINQIIQNMTTFASSYGIQLNSVSDVKSNADLMNMINIAWHN